MGERESGLKQMAQVATEQLARTHRPTDPQTEVFQSSQTSKARESLVQVLAKDRERMLACTSRRRGELAPTQGTCTNAGNLHQIKEKKMLHCARPTSQH